MSTTRRLINPDVTTSLENMKRKEIDEKSKTTIATETITTATSPSSSSTSLLSDVLDGSFDLFRYRLPAISPLNSSISSSTMINNNNNNNHLEDKMMRIALEQSSNTTEMDIISNKTEQQHPYSPAASTTSSDEDDEDEDNSNINTETCKVNPYIIKNTTTTTTTTTTAAATATATPQVNVDIGFSDGLLRKLVKSSSLLSFDAIRGTGVDVKQVMAISSKSEKSSSLSPSKRNVIVHSAQSQLHDSDDEDGDGNDHKIQDNNNNNQADNESSNKSGCFFVQTSTMFLREEVNTALANVLSNRKSKTTSLRKKLSKENLMEVIPETKVFDKPVQDRPVTILSMLNTNGPSTLHCAQFISKTLHTYISSHTKFTCMKNVPQVVRESFKAVDDAYIRQVKGENKLSGCDCITLVISGDEVCVAHVGGARAVVAGNDGKALQLTSDQKPSSQGEVERIEQSGCIIHHGMIDNSLKFSRSFGNASIKKTFPNAIISIPDTCHFRVVPPKKINRSRTNSVSSNNSSSPQSVADRARKLFQRFSRLKLESKVPSSRSLDTVNDASSTSMSSTSRQSSLDSNNNNNGNPNESKLFIILANDPVWEVISNVEACKLVGAFFSKKGKIQPNAEAAATYMMKKVAKRLRKKTTPERNSNGPTEISICIIRWLETEEDEELDQYNLHQVMKNKTAQQTESSVKQAIDAEMKARFGSMPYNPLESGDKSRAQTS